MHSHISSASFGANFEMRASGIEGFAHRDWWMQISVDGDTSTNDTVLGLASGKAGGKQISDPASKEGLELEAAVTALLQVCREPCISCFFLEIILDSFCKSLWYTPS